MALNDSLLNTVDLPPILGGVLLIVNTILGLSQTIKKDFKMQATGEQNKMDYVAIKNAAMTLRSINHKLRQQILKLLEENKRMNVTDIYVKLRLEQSVASQHLAILRRANIVSTERMGKEIFYSIKNNRIEQVALFANRIAAE